MAIEPGVHNLTVYQGAYWSQAVLWKDADDVPVDLTGYTARMQARKNFQDEDVIILLETNPAPGGAAGNGRITLGLVEETPGTPLYNILLEIEASVTALLEATPSDRRWRYDLELVPAGGEVRRLLMGKFIVSLEITR